MRSKWMLLPVLVLLSIAGCGGSSASSGGRGITPPPAPTVSSTSPAASAKGVAISAVIKVTFSTAMDASSISTSSFTVTNSAGKAVAGAVTYDSSSDSATFTPSNSLAYGTIYTVKITTGAQSSGGTALTSDYSWTFTTVSAPAAPQVSSTTPTDGATEAAINIGIRAIFSEAMDASTITTSTFELTASSGATVAGAVSYNATGSVATFTPAASLSADTTYTATITTGAKSSTGLALTAPVTWSFTTASVPIVLSTTPISGATGVGTTSDVTATFTQAMDPSTLTTSTFTLSSSTGSVAAAVTYASGGDTATLTPTAALASDTSYTATITTGVMNAGSVPLRASYSWSFTTGSGSSDSVTVDYGTADQLINGFGGSTAFLGTLTTQQATALFSPISGLGLSILRVRIAPNGSASNNFVTDQWTEALTNAQEAQSANPNAIVLASPWTPPPAWKASSTSQPFYSGTPPCSSTALCGGYLEPSHYANYLENFVTYFKNNGVNLYGVSMQNEPDYSAQSDENYESCSWTPAQMDTWVANDASVLTTRLIMPESYSFNPKQAAVALNDPKAVGKISIVAGHLYGTTPSYDTQAENLGKPVWMTEHYLTPKAVTGTQPAMTDALAAAEEIQKSMLTAEYNAYVWWWVWNDPYDNVNYGLINSSTATPAPTYYGYALGQFSKFIQPGYHRYNATANPATNVYVSAYAGDGHYVIVAINAGSSAVSQTFHIQNATITSMTPWQTTSSGGLQKQSTVSVSSDSFMYTLPAQSITTFVE